MQSLREKLRRVVHLATVNKVTQLSAESLETAAEQALSAVLKHTPQADLAALDRWASCGNSDVGHELCA
jgi:hypothetical protein